MMEEDDEIITVQLPRKEYKILRQVIEREEAYSWFKRQLATSWIWIVGGGALTLLLLWDKVYNLFDGVR